MTLFLRHSLLCASIVILGCNSKSEQVRVEIPQTSEQNATIAEDSSIEKEQTVKVFPGLTPVDGDYSGAVSLYDSGDYSQLDVISYYAAQQDPGACLRLGVAYLKGQGVNKNIDRAVTLLDCAGAKGDRSALNWKGLALTEAGGDENLAKAIASYETNIATSPDAGAMLGLRVIYMNEASSHFNPSLSARYAVRAHILGNVSKNDIITDLSTYYRCETLFKATNAEKSGSGKACASDDAAARRENAAALLESLKNQDPSGFGVIGTN